MKNIRTAMGRHLNYPINPFLMSSVGIFSMVWAFWVLIPKHSATTLITYKVFTLYGINYLMFFAAFAIGLWLFLTPLFAKHIKAMAPPLMVMSVFWFSISTFVAFGDWTTNTWLVYAFLGIYCLIGTANFRVNQNSQHYADMMNP